MEGKVVRVGLADGERSSWTSVPAALGGGGGIWGWGGVACSRAADLLLVATGNAFSGGSNVGAAFSESAGYGEQLVGLTPDLAVVGASHPRDIKPKLDLDFVGSPVVASPPGCPELALVLNKNGVLYAWRTDRIAAGPEWSVRVARTTPDAPVLTQPAWSPGLGSAYVVGLRNVTRVAVGADCRPSVAWSRPLGAGLQNSSPTLAGRMLWFVRNGDSGALLLGLDPADGSVRCVRPRLCRPSRHLRWSAVACTPARSAAC